VAASPLPIKGKEAVPDPPHLIHLTSNVGLFKVTRIFVALTIHFGSFMEPFHNDRILRVCGLTDPDANAVNG
jgi:hypothetical protein